VVRTTIEGRYEEAAAPFEFAILGDPVPAQHGYTKVSTTSGTMPTHRAVMTSVLGRRLVDLENVHHINGVRDDNRPENLELWVMSQPAGQRVSDLIEYVVLYHREAVLERLAQ